MRSPAAFSGPALDTLERSSHPEIEMQLDGRRRLLALAALLPLMLISASGGRASWFRCQLTGAVSADPCCPADAAPAAGDTSARPATVAAVDCCLRETVSIARPPAEAPVAPAHEGGAIVSTAVGDLNRLRRCHRW